MTHFVYILQCFDNRNNTASKYYYYRGYTNNIRRRYSEHKRGYSKYTKRFQGRLNLVYIEVIEDRNKHQEFLMARKREKVVKKWSRIRIEKIIKLKKEQLQELINKYFQVSVDY